jgi:outer membrane protein TolC
VIPGGFYDALGQVFGFSYTTYSLGLTLNLPLRDRTNAAAMANALVQKKSDLLALRSSEQRLRLGVLNAITAVVSSRESVKQSIVARDLAAKQLEAENEKYKLGVDPMFNLLDAQAKLTAAESAVVTNSISYWQNMTALLTATGTLLEDRGIVLQ